MKEEIELILVAMLLSGLIIISVVGGAKLYLKIYNPSKVEYERINRAIKYIYLSEFCREVGDMRICVNENMTLKEVREVYLKYMGYTVYVYPAMNVIIKDICDGG